MDDNQPTPPEEPVWKSFSWEGQRNHLECQRIIREMGGLRYNVRFQSHPLKTMTHSHKFKFCTRCETDKPPEGGVDMSPTRWICMPCWVKRINKR